MTELAMFGAGCFWSPEYHFSQLPGVERVTSGYAGGHLDNPTYWDVASQESGHAEVVQIEFDPEKISYEQLLDVFWAIHDPTQLNRQGPDIGPEYRSAIFYYSHDQHQLANQTLKEEQQTLERPIATEVVEASTFYPAEDYHQNFIERTGRFCHPQRRPYKKLSAAS